MLTSKACRQPSPADCVVAGGEPADYCLSRRLGILQLSRAKTWRQSSLNSGGTAVAEARLAWNDDRGFASDVIPGFELAELFGAREKMIQPSDHPNIMLDKSSDFADLTAGSPVTGEAFEEDLEPLAGAHVLGHFADGQPAMVEKSSGKGNAVLVGSFLGLAYQRQHADSVKQLVLSLAKRAGVQNEVTAAGPDVSQLEIRRLGGQRSTSPVRL
jgi:beta-galactosidase